MAVEDWALGEYVNPSNGFPIRVSKGWYGVVVSITQTYESNSSLTPDEAEALATMLQYAAKLAREEALKHAHPF